MGGSTLRIGVLTFKSLCIGFCAAWVAAAYAEVPDVVVNQSGADSGWHFGIGTGLSSFSLDGDIGFATSEGGLIGDIDLDNSDTGDLVESAFGLGGVAMNGPWVILASYGTVTLEDGDGAIDAEWDRAKTELMVGYRILRLGRNDFRLLGGVRNISHEWKIKLKDPDLAGLSVPDVDDDWTDGVVGIAHTLPLGDRWLWSNRADMGFGDTEESLSAITTLFWMPFPHWAFNVSARYTKLEIGQKSDINDSDFYYYDVDEPSFGIGFMYLW